MHDAADHGQEVRDVVCAGPSCGRSADGRTIMTLMTLAAPGAGLLLMLALQRMEAWMELGGPVRTPVTPRATRSPARARMPRVRPRLVLDGACGGGPSPRSFRRGPCRRDEGPDRRPV